MCPQGQGKKLNPAYKGGASGHVFVLIKADQKWKLINSTYSPFDQKIGPHAKDILQVRRLLSAKFSTQKEHETSHQKAKEVIRTLTYADIEALDFESPTDLKLKFDKGTPVLVPEFQSLPETLSGEDEPLNFRKMIIFEVIGPNDYDLHKWKDRYNIIVSGNKSSNICRFTLR